MIKKILVPTDGSECAAIGVQYAVSLAAQHDALLLGLYVVDIKLLEGPFLRDISASLGTAPFVNYQNNVAMILEERGKAALEAFTQACDAAGVRHETTQVTGPIAKSIVEQSELTDLAIMGRGGEHGDWLDGLLGSTTQAVVRRAECPVLVTGKEAADIKHFVVAYDGSGHAKKALQFAAEIGETWKVPFDVLAIGSKNAEAALDEAKSYLEAHEVEASYQSREGEVAATLLAYTRESEADLLVMGAYGHSKVHELVVGSTTAHVLNQSDFPILLTR